MFAVSALYTLAHTLAAPTQKSGDYAMHFTGAMFRTLGKYWTWSIGPAFAYTPIVLPAWVLPSGIGIVSIAVIAFAMEFAMRALERRLTPWKGKL